MDFDFDFLIMETEEKMELALDQYDENLAKISVGRANPKILDRVKVDYYGTLTQVNQIASISVPEPRQLLIKPYDMTTTKHIVGAINSASLGVNAVDEGDKARITFPELTTDRRRDLVKSLGQYTEQARVKVRNARQDANKAIKAEDSLPEDDSKAMQEDVQKLTDKFIAKIDARTKDKESELMTI